MLVCFYIHENFVQKKKLSVSQSTASRTLTTKREKNKKPPEMKWNEFE